MPHCVLVNVTGFSLESRTRKQVTWTARTCSAAAMVGVVSHDAQPLRLRGWLLHGLHDEAKHSGEMYLLWKLREMAGE